MQISCAYIICKLFSKKKKKPEFLPVAKINTLFISNNPFEAYDGDTILNVLSFRNRSKESTNAVRFID